MSAIHIPGQRACGKGRLSGTRPSGAVRVQFMAAVVAGRPFMFAGGGWNWRSGCVCFSYLVRVLRGRDPFCALPSIWNQRSPAVCGRDCSSGIFAGACLLDAAGMVRDFPAERIWERWKKSGNQGLFGPSEEKGMARRERCLLPAFLLLGMGCLAESYINPILLEQIFHLFR